MKSSVAASKLHQKWPNAISTFLGHTLIILCLLLPSLVHANADELIAPSATFSASDVLTFQLTSLQNNDSFNGDRGIEQTYKFAHPKNKSVTGPLERFKKLIYSSNYKSLLGHKEHKFNMISETANRTTFNVKVRGSDNLLYRFLWTLEKVQKLGPLRDCWLTISVSIPLGRNLSV